MVIEIGTSGRQRARKDHVTMFKSLDTWNRLASSGGRNQSSLTMVWLELLRLTEWNEKFFLSISVEVGGFGSIGVHQIYVHIADVGLDSLRDKRM